MQQNIKLNNSAIDSSIVELYKFLERRTAFLVGLEKFLDENQTKIRNYFKQYEKQNQDRTRGGNNAGPTPQSQNQLPILPNNESITFLIQLPHMFVYTMAYHESQQHREEIRSSIKNSIFNIIRALNHTPYDLIWRNFSKSFNLELYIVMTKLLQFLYILQKKTQESEQNQQNLMFARQQIESKQQEEIIKGTLKLLKMCPEDFQSQRVEIMSRLKYLINCITPTQLSSDLRDLIDEEVIMGKSKFMSEYTKNALYNFWIEILKTIYCQPPPQ
jgi:hypothetical protein